MTTNPASQNTDEPMNSLSPTWPIADEAVREALLEAFANGAWGKYEGPYIARLTDLLAEFHTARFAFPCCSGTFAVELALRALRIESPNEVILAGYDFGGNFRAIEAVGAVPVLVDIVPDTWCLAADAVSQAISPDTRAVIVSHLHGGIADMKSLRELAVQHEMVLIEDACQAPGALVQGRMAGTWGDVGVLSFGGSKLLTAGRGGAIITNHEAVLQRAKIFCERGNHAFPLSELQAAVLIPQLAKLADRNNSRRKSVSKLIAATSGIEALTPVGELPDESAASYFKLAWKYHPERCGGWSREQFVAAVQAEGVSLDTGFRGFVRRGNRCRRAGNLEHSSAAAEQTVILHHPVLLESEATVQQVAEILHKVVTMSKLTS
jgi:dTDP-4-amino-4,6-dideoxygalactose transaminase